MKLDVCIDYVRNSLCGLPNYKLGCDMHKILKDNAHVFEDYFKDEFNVDMNEKLTEKAPSCISHDEDFGARMNGYDSCKDYYKDA